MNDFPEGTKSAFARAVSAEVRATMAAQRVSGRVLALAAGFRSHNYLAMRLRDDAPFTLDDIDAICRHFDEERDAFMQRAYDNHIERLWTESMDARRAAQRLASDPSATTGLTQADYAEVALDGDEEAGASEFDD